ncbi:DUF7282 domain-containing protein [Halocalculus aciditolerans]|uniref:DUF7282 domain-containing protein n=1 Tax=Halocalculus aciditolerans TaxID=1383812 RepID=A0A830F9W9_9EURY|nr:PGF-CTERM sorting domain-containing protein [Halocalculus aciditolerans]GGL54343.1 hypothetical protein GCM10009039_10640 [Halocalculus aciditolerans]
MRQRIQAIALTALLVVSLAGVAAPVAAQSAGASATISNQTSGGSTVTVDSVTLPDGGFVTIHDASVTDGDVLGSVVGSSTYLAAGTHQNVTVRLDEPLADSGTFVAMPHMDTDGDRVYEFVSANGAADGPYTADGSAVVDTANVTVAASVSMSAQPTDGDSVVVDRVELSQPGFVTVHGASVTDGKVFESIKGTSPYLSAGVHENVRVDLDTAVGNTTLVPMAHVDTNGNEMYDFVTSEGEADGPFTTADGSAVVDTASVTTAQHAMVSVSNQTTGGHAATVDSVFLPDGGFVTVHDGTVTDGKVFDSIKGTSRYLEPGLHRNVQITLDAPYTDDGTLVPMAHEDTNDNETYDFVTSEGASDGPYTADGSAVVDTASATVSASVALDAQQSDGHTVVIDTVDMTDGGFVAVHDPSLGAGNVLGSVVGHSTYLDAGVHHNVTVTLDTPVNESQALVAMPHLDSNGNEMYDFVTSEGSNDGPYAANGGAVVDTGKALVTATVVADAQTAENGETVTVDSVTLANGGFVTIHDASLADGAVFDSVRGTSAYLSAGTHENVTVALDDPLSESATVYAMAHADSNGNEMYDFVTSEGANDGPYTANGAPVMASADVTVESTTTAMQSTTTATDETTMQNTTQTNSPGFGLVAAALALLGAALVALRRQD